MTAPQRHVIYIDDDDDWRMLVSETLRGAGYSVTPYESSRDALRAWEHAAKACEPGQRPADAILSDVMMPGDIDGRALAHRIREVEAERKLRPAAIMLISAADGTQERLAGLASGADQYVTKPTSQKTLVRIVDGIMRPDLSTSNGS